MFVCVCCFCFEVWFVVGCFYVVLYCYVVVEILEGVD